jgi:hypothetical protein
VPSGEYGGAGDPAWQHGFSLAHKNRRLLGLDETSPIDSMRDLCDRLGIPLLQAELPDTIVGATLEVHQVRGVLVNIRGDNENVWVRRARPSRMSWATCSGIRARSWNTSRWTRSSSSKRPIRRRASAL